MANEVTENGKILTNGSQPDPIKNFFAHKESKDATNMPVGHCIRTGVEIPFNLGRPLSITAFEAWAQLQDNMFPENFCHFSGEPSYGKTCKKFPVLEQYYEQARKIQSDLNL